jgi:hypothetical protein
MESRGRDEEGTRVKIYGSKSSSVHPSVAGNRN